MGSRWSQKLMNRYYRAEDHPFSIFDRRIASLVDDRSAVLDAGCGAHAPLLVNLIGKGTELIGVDLVKFDPALKEKGLVLLNSDLANMDLANGSIDLVISRSVLEHIPDVESVYREIHRILRPGGRFVFLIPNLWDYVSVVSYLVPNSLHRSIVSRLTGRPSEDTFPTYYRSNTSGSIKSLARKTGFEVGSVEYYGQYPYMLAFNPLLFMLGVVYDKTITNFTCLRKLRGWILAELKKLDQTSTFC